MFCPSFLLYRTWRSVFCGFMVLSLGFSGFWEDGAAFRRKGDPWFAYWVMFYFGPCWGIIVHRPNLGNICFFVTKIFGDGFCYLCSLVFFLGLHGTLPRFFLRFLVSSFIFLLLF